MLPSARPWDDRAALPASARQRRRWRRALSAAPLLPLLLWPLLSPLLLSPRPPPPLLVLGPGRGAPRREWQPGAGALRRGRPAPEPEGVAALRARRRLVDVALLDGEAVCKKLGVDWLREDGFLQQVDGGFLVRGGLNSLQDLGSIYFINQRFSQDPREPPQATG